GKGWSDYASCFEYFSYVRQRGSFEYIFGEATRDVDSRWEVNIMRRARPPGLWRVRVMAGCRCPSSEHKTRNGRRLP
ncbi:MAG: hypothetical protein ABIL25_02000, partial [candidate division WOR-3 bacterium]